MSFRKVLFWVHLVAGLISGLAIAIMCFTGTMLAFEKEIIAWSERDARRIEVPAHAQRLSLDELQRRLRAAQPEARPASIVIQNDPAAAVAFTTGRTGAFYVNPYTGEVRQPKSATMGAFMHAMVDWHRYLNFHGEQTRPVGKLINGICNLAFAVLAVTGLYLWMPRQWSWRALRPIAWFRQNTSGKARDFNWHNTIGLWTAPILIVLTLTAVPISFQWGGRLIFTLTGTAAPAPGSTGPGALAGPPVEVPTPPAGATPLTQDALLAAAQKHAPDWKTITIRTGAPVGRSGRGPRPASADTPSSSRPEAPRPDSARPTSSAPQAATFTIRHAASWPRTATTTLALNPFTGDLLRRTGYADMNAAQQVRSWTRFLHTGEAVGPIGQIVAGLACLGGLFLVYTGFALSWRRFFGKRIPADNAAAATASTDALVSSAK